MYTSLQKSFLSLASIPCGVLLFGIYKYSKRHLVAASDSLEQRMERWYAAMSGIMLGIFIFRTLPQSSTASGTSVAMGWSYQTLAVFVMIGFYALMWFDKIGRVWNYSTTFSGLTAEEATETLQPRHIVDRQNIEITEYADFSATKLVLCSHILGTMKVTTLQATNFRNNCT